MRFLPTLLALVVAFGGDVLLAGAAEPELHAGCTEAAESDACCDEGCEDGCGDERDDCADCTSCSGCPCCPPRTGTISPGFVSLAPRSIEASSAVTPLVEPVLSASCADIFHPPRA